MNELTNIKKRVEKLEKRKDFENGEIVINYIDDRQGDLLHVCGKVKVPFGKGIMIDQEADEWIPMHK